MQVVVTGMTRENCAFYPQVTQGVKMCSQFVLCWIRKEKKKENTGLCSVLSIAVPCFLWVTCIICAIQIFHFNFQYFSIFEVCVNTYVWFNDHFNRTASDIKSTTKHQTQHQKETNPIQQAPSNHKDKERVWALAQELLILGELARPTASKCITYGVPFSQLPQREHKKCYI